MQPGEKKATIYVLTIYTVPVLLLLSSTPMGFFPFPNMNNIFVKNNVIIPNVFFKLEYSIFTFLITCLVLRTIFLSLLLSRTIFPQH